MVWEFWLDGVAVQVEAEPKTPTLEVLRDQLGVYTAKAGCSPQGLCGCCTVLIDGKPRLTCTLPVKSLAGKRVQSLSGLPPDEQAELAAAFAATGAAQCGYCTPAILLSASCLLAVNPAPSHEEQAKALNLHLCRCTGYTAIYAAIDRAAALRRGELAPPAPTSRPDATAITLGQRPFVDDLMRPGLLHTALVFAPTARGRVEAVNLAAAAAAPGVVTTHLYTPEGSEIGHAGVPVAAVVATSQALASAAAALVTIELAPLPEPETSLQAGFRRSDGDADLAFAHAAVRVELSQACAASGATPLEPEVALAVPEGDGIVVYSGCHDGSGDLGVAGARVVLVPSGGSYGAKDRYTVEPLAAALADALRRPVRVGLSMAEGQRLHSRRPGGSSRARLGAASDGTLLALDLEVELDGGVLTDRADVLVSLVAGAVPYRAKNLKLRAQLRASSAPRTGRIRGATALATATLERAVDQLAAALGRPPEAVRRQLLPDWAPLFDTMGAGPLSVAEAEGEGGARVWLKVTGPDEIEVTCNVPDLGQGRDARLLATLVRETGLLPEVFCFPWGRGEALGPAAPAGAPVELAAQRAAAGLVRRGGALQSLQGEVFEGAAPEKGAPGQAAARAELGDAGGLDRVTVAVACGEEQDPVLIKNLGEGALHMATGMALSEEAAHEAGLPETRLRFLGVLKPKGCPTFEVRPVPIAGGPRDPSEAVIAAGVAAIIAAVERAEGSSRSFFPMKDSAPARALGVRKPG